MTRKHFELIARTVKECGGIDAHSRGCIARAFADMCEAQNPLFNRARFLAACGLQEG